MCSITDATPAPVTVPALAALVEHLHEAATAVTAALSSDPVLLAGVPDALLESMALELHGSVDAATAAATVVTGRVDQQIGDVRGLLVGGLYPSTRRWLEAEAGFSPQAAKAMVGRGRDLVTHSTRVADAWLAGAIPGGAVRPLTSGVSEVIRRSQVHDPAAARTRALDALLPIAAERDAPQLQKAVATLKLLLDPDGCTEAARHAGEQQSLSIVEQGGVLHVCGTLPLDTGAATLTVVERRARLIVAPHVTVVTDLTDSTSPLIGALTVPGSDHDALIPEVTVRRLLCDSDVTRVVTTTLTRPAPCRTGRDGEDAFTTALVDAVRTEARSVLYVGRAQRTVTARLRRALEVRDGHCAFPGCHAHVRRCHAHHVQPRGGRRPDRPPRTWP